VLKEATEEKEVFKVPVIRDDDEREKMREIFLLQSRSIKNNNTILRFHFLTLTAVPCVNLNQGRK
jgi:hypothetical protein